MLITVCSHSGIFAQVQSSTDSISNDTIPKSVSQLDSLSADSTKKDTTISPDAIESKVDYESLDSMTIDMSIEKVFLYNQGQVNYENIQLNADYIEVDLKNDMVTANGVKDSTGKMVGLPIFREGTQEYNAGKMRYNFNTKKGKISEVRTQEGEGYIKGYEVKKTGTEVLYIKNGYYTTCNLDHPHFSLATSKLKIIPGNKIVTGPTVLKINEVPTPLGLPFGLFPNKKGRSSGILIPTYGDSRNLGFFLRNGGFYWGGSDRIDASITGDIYSLGSWAMNASSRYRTRYKYNGNMSVSFSKRKEGIEETPNYTEISNMFVRWTHSQDAKARPGSRFSANVNVGSSNNFRNNLNSFSNEYLTNTFQSSITYSNSFPSKPYNLTLSARHSQNTQNNAFNISLPDVSFNVSRQYPFKSLGKVGNQWWRSTYKNFGLSYNSTATNQLNTIDTLIAINKLGELAQDFRNGVRHSVPINTSFKLLKYLNFSPSVNYSEVWAFETIRRSEEWVLTPNATDPTKTDSTATLFTDTVGGFERGGSYNFNAALTTKLYSIYQFKKGKIKAVRHVMTPSVSYSFQPEINTGLQSYTNVNGEEVEYSIFEQTIYGRPDRLKSGNIGISLLNNIEMKVESKKDTSGVKKIKLLENLGFNTSYNIDADSLNWSNVTFNGRTRIGRFLTLQFNGAVDPYGLYTDTLERTFRVNESYYSQTGKLGRLTSASGAINLRFTGGKKDKKKKESKNATAEELEFIENNPELFIDFDIPWSLNINYNIRYSKPLLESNVTQTLNFNGDLSVTKNWKISATSGWDFEQRDFSYTSLNINRDLHCWQMAIVWIPFGPRQSYNLTLNVKSSVLQDLRLNRRRDFYDINRQF